MAVSVPSQHARGSELSATTTIALRWNTGLVVVSRNHGICGLAMRQGIGTQPDASAAFASPFHLIDAASSLPNARAMSPELAAKSYDILLDPKHGFSRQAAIDIEGVRKVLSLRSQYGEPKKLLDDPMKYLDLTYYNRALTP